jgi:haloacetate dehalogenase
MFEGFTHERIRTGEAEIDLVRGGAGPPLLLLHGYPQNKAMWHKIAPGLAAHFTVIAPDLRGYGDSSHPPDADDNRAYSKRAMAADQVAVMGPTQAAGRWSGEQSRSCGDRRRAVRGDCETDRAAPART